MHLFPTRPAHESITAPFCRLRRDLRLPAAAGGARAGAGPGNRYRRRQRLGPADRGGADAVRGRSEEHTSELQSLMRISYAVFCLKKKKTTKQNTMNKI